VTWPRGDEGRGNPRWWHCRKVKNSFLLGNPELSRSTADFPLALLMASQNFCVSSFAYEGVPC